MTNNELLTRYAKRYTNKDISANSLSIRDGVLYSYSTPISYRDTGRIIVTRYKYSPTTSKQTTQLLNILKEYGYKYQITYEPISII